MTADEIRAAVQASPQLQRLAAAGNIVALTSMLRLLGQRVQAGEVITARSAAARWPSIGQLPGPLAFEVTLSALENYATANAASPTLANRLRARAIARVLQVFESNGLDFGDPALRTSLETLAADLLTTAQMEAFKSLGRRQPADVTEREVREAVGVVLPSARVNLPSWPATP